MSKPLKLVKVRPARMATQTRKPSSPKANAPSGAMVAPEHLTAAEAETFRGIVGLLASEGRESPSHVEAVALLAQRLEEIKRTSADIEERGMSYETRSDRGGNLIIRANPAVAQRSEAMRHAHGLLAELGLTPAAAHRMLAEQKDATPSEFEEFA